MPNMVESHVVIKRIALSIFASSTLALGQTKSTLPTTAPAWDVLADTWVATDGLGRTLPTFEDVGAPKPDRTAAMFYYLWLDDREPDVHDMAKRLARFPASRVRPGTWWWWGEPVLGYYVNTDPFVIRTHAQQLSDAGVDTLVFDSTNGFTHEPEYTALFTEFTAMRQRGLATPQIAHITNHEPLKTVQKLYDEFYAKQLWPDLWFRWQGKPLILTDPETLTPALKDFFTVRRSWAWHGPTGWFGDGHDKWPWIDTYPQQFGWHDDAKTPEQLSVSAGQHPSSTIGRAYSNGKNPPIVAGSDMSKGIYFEEQWSQLHKVNPPFLFITNWNEWWAKSYADDKPKGQPRNFVGKPMEPGEGFFVDEYDPEFSRDIEPAMPTPANRGVDDNYYYQLVSHLRRYKGVRPIEPVAPKPIVIDGKFDDWTDAAPEFRDAIGDPVDRDWPGSGGKIRYVNHTGRNDLVAAHVSFDAQNVYFHVRCAKPITARSEDDWMVLYLDTDSSAKTGWLGYDFCVSGAGVATKTTTLEKNVGGKYAWDNVAKDVAYAVSGEQMELAIPRRLLGDPKTIDFKWADHVIGRADWTDFTLNGDSAPNARFNYRAKLTDER